MKKRLYITLACLFFVVCGFAKPTDSLRVEMRNGAKYIMHKVEQKESLAILSARYGVTESEIISANPLVTVEAKPGQILLIPVNAQKYSNVEAEVIKPATESTVPQATVLPAPSSREVVKTEPPAKPEVNNVTAQKPENKPTPPPVETKPVKETAKKEPGSILRTEISGNDTFLVYQVGREVSVAEVASKFEVPEKNIKNYNSLSSVVLTNGQILKIFVNTSVEPIASNSVVKAEPKKEAKAEEKEESKTEAKADNKKVNEPKKPLKFKEKDEEESNVVVSSTKGFATNAHDYNLTDYRENAGLEDVWAEQIISDITINVSSMVQSTGKGTSKTTHVVKEGETLQSIAKSYGLRVTDIINWNGLNNYRVREGQDLIINQARYDENYYKRNSLDKINTGEVNNVERVVEVGLGAYSHKTKFIGVLHATLPPGKLIKIVNRGNFLETYARVTGKIPESVDKEVIIMIDDNIAERLKINNPLVNVEITYGTFD